MQIVRGEMEVARIGEIVEIEIVPGQLGNGSHISKDVAPRVVVENHGESGGAWAGDAPDQSSVDAALPEALERDVAEGVVANAGLKSYATAEHGKVVGDDGRRRTESQHHTVGQEFALGSEFLGEAVEDEVEIELTRDRYIETGHGGGRNEEFRIPMEANPNDLVDPSSNLQNAKPGSAIRLELPRFQPASTRAHLILRRRGP